MYIYVSERPCLAQSLLILLSEVLHQTLTYCLFRSCKMKPSIAVIIMASCAGMAAACTSNVCCPSITPIELWNVYTSLTIVTQVYEHCTHYIPRSDSDPYIKCSNTNQCIDACKARTGKCDKHYQAGELAVGCAKLIGNMKEYCVAFETTCKIGQSASASE